MRSFHQIKLHLCLTDGAWTTLSLSRASTLTEVHEGSERRNDIEVEPGKGL